MGVEVLHAFLLRRRRKTTPNKESSRKEMRE